MTPFQMQAGAQRGQVTARVTELKSSYTGTRLGFVWLPIPHSFHLPGPPPEGLSGWDFWRGFFVKLWIRESS